MSYVGLNALVIATSIAIWVELLPPFAKNQSHVSTEGVGVIWAVDSIVVVIAQLPMAKLMEGHRRMRGLALMCAVWAASLLGFDSTGYWTSGWIAAGVLARVTLL